MSPVSLQSFRVKVQAFDGKTFRTASQQRPYVVRVRRFGLEFTPKSTGKARRHQWNYVERVLDRFDECRSFNPSKYQDVTHNASYVLPLLRAIVETE